MSQNMIKYVYMGAIERAEISKHSAKSMNIFCMGQLRR